MALVAPFLSTRKEKAAPKIPTKSGWTAQKLCNRLKDCRLTGTSRSVKPEKGRCRTFAMDPVYNNLSNFLAGIWMAIWRRVAFGRVMNRSKRNSLSQDIKSFTGLSIRCFWTDLKLCIPDSESPLWIWRSPCTELTVPPWTKKFEEWAISTTLVARSKWDGGRELERWNDDSSFLSTASKYTSIKPYSTWSNSYPMGPNLKRVQGTHDQEDALSMA